MFDAQKTQNWDEEENDDDPDSFQPPVVKEMLSINANVLPLFKDAGLTKGAGVTMPDMRSVVTEYVRKNDLGPAADAADKSRVKLNPEMAGILLEKGENNVVELTWNQIFTRLPKKMGQCYRYTVFPKRYERANKKLIAYDERTMNWEHSI